jgi:glutamyl-tRNA reductase
MYLAYFDESTDVQMSHDFEIFRDKKAYQFLLEVVCGLHSPVVGETEVFGQFRTFWQNNEFFYPLRQIMDSVIIDAKKIRGQHLKDLGGQSYGSLIRKMLKSPAQVAMIGSGAFVQDILPWIYKDENQISLFARNTTAARALQAEREKISVHSLDEKIELPVVIVAAPLTSQEIQALVVNKDALVIDLRGESVQDRCTQFKNYKDLSAFFKAIEKNQSKITQAKTDALQAIGEMGQQRFNSESLRPFGWDDICVW